MIAIGQRVRFDPFRDIRGYGVEEIRGAVTGTVVMVNTSKRWFSVEYGEPKARASFNFCDIGKDVELCQQ